MEDPEQSQTQTEVTVTGRPTARDKATTWTYAEGQSDRRASAHDVRRQHQHKHATGGETQQATGLPLTINTSEIPARWGADHVAQIRVTRGGPQLRVRPPQLRVDDSVCRDEDLHALMEIDAITMPQDTHVRGD